MRKTYQKRQRSKKQIEGAGRLEEVIKGEVMIVR
jgi:hypothetical protein